MTTAGLTTGGPTWGWLDDLRAPERARVHLILVACASPDRLAGGPRDSHREPATQELGSHRVQECPVAWVRPAAAQPFGQPGGRGELFVSGELDHGPVCQRAVDAPRRELG